MNALQRANDMTEAEALEHEEYVAFLDQQRRQRAAYAKWPPRIEADLFGAFARDHVRDLVEMVGDSPRLQSAILIDPGEAAYATGGFGNGRTDGVQRELYRPQQNGTRNLDGSHGRYKWYLVSTGAAYIFEAHHTQDMVLTLPPPSGMLANQLLFHRSKIAIYESAFRECKDVNSTPRRDPFEMAFPARQWIWRYDVLGPAPDDYVDHSSGPALLRALKGLYEGHKKQLATLQAQYDALPEVVAAHNAEARRERNRNISQSRAEQEDQERMAEINSIRLDG